MKTEKEIEDQLLEEGVPMLREELETAWLRGYSASIRGTVLGDGREAAAADYAERVVGGSTRPQRPEVD